MKFYFDFIKRKYKCSVEYIDHNKVPTFLKRWKNKTVHLYDPVDHLVIKDLKKYNINLELYDTQLFLHTEGEMEDKSDFMHKKFYIWSRKKLDILMDKSKPKGGKWSYDVKNRKPFPKNQKDFMPKPVINRYTKEAVKYVEKNFEDNFGKGENYLPTDFDGARKYFKLFLKERFKCFGPFQDAVRKDIIFGCHSVISGLLNIGLLDVEYVVREAESYGLKNRVPLQSVEGFLRQIVGWREYVRMMYVFKRGELERGNHFNHRRRIGKSWYDATTGVELIDDMIKKVIKYAYLHHIERLMYIGNFMLISKFLPKDCFKWFMVVSIDSYNWVMYPNVYGMSQYSAGNLMMKRPYFSSSAYIERMSDYGRSEYWDALYYSFINDNKIEFRKNYATAAQVRHWDNKSSGEKKKILELAKG